MNTNWSKLGIFLALIVMMSAGGCLETPVKTQSINHSQVLEIEGKEDWMILLDDYPLYRGIDLYKNTGYGVTKVTFEYIYIIQVRERYCIQKMILIMQIKADRTIMSVA